jgi:hypothetical protein
MKLLLTAAVVAGWGVVPLSAQAVSGAVLPARSDFPITPVPAVFRVSPGTARRWEHTASGAPVGRAALIGAAVGVAGFAAVVLLHPGSGQESKPGLALEIPIEVGGPAAIGALIGLAAREQPARRARSASIAGTVFGALAGGWALHRFCRHQSGFPDDSCVRYTALGADLGGLIGALLGYGLGSSAR